jgi:hypothetical protein
VSIVSDLLDCLMGNDERIWNDQASSSHAQKDPPLVLDLFIWGPWCCWGSLLQLNWFNFRYWCSPVCPIITEYIYIHINIIYIYPWSYAWFYTRKTPAGLASSSRPRFFRVQGPINTAIQANDLWPLPEAIAKADGLPIRWHSLCWTHKGYAKSACLWVIQL